MSDYQPTEAEVEAAALAWDKSMGGRYQPDAVEELSAEVRVILIAAHEARTVTTVEELEALPLDSVVLDSYREHGDVYRISETHDESGFHRVYDQVGPQGRFRAIALPATVLHYGAGE